MPISCFKVHNENFFKEIPYKNIKILKYTKLHIGYSKSYANLIMKNITFVGNE